MFQEIYIIDNHEELTKSLEKLFSEQTNYKFINVNETQINNIFENIPEIIIINEDNINMEAKEICTIIRKNEDNNITPLIVVTSNESKEHKIELAKDEIEYYIPNSMGLEYLYYKIKNISRLLAMNRTVSPLTGLPRKCSNTERIEEKITKKGDFFSTIFRFR